MEGTGVRWQGGLKERVGWRPSDKKQRRGRPDVSWISLTGLYQRQRLELALNHPQEMQLHIWSTENTCADSWTMFLCSASHTASSLCSSCCAILWTESLASDFTKASRGLGSGVGQRLRTGQEAW